MKAWADRWKSGRAGDGGGGGAGWGRGWLGVGMTQSEADKLARKLIGLRVPATSECYIWSRTTRQKKEEKIALMEFHEYVICLR